MQRLHSSYWHTFKFWTLRNHMHRRFVAGAKHDGEAMQTFLNEMHAHKFYHTGRRP